MRRIALLALILAGCGESTGGDWAAPQTVGLGWHGTDGGIAYVVRSVSLTAQGWRVDASVTNTTATTLAVNRPHHKGMAKFGLLVSREQRAPPATSELRDLRTPFFADVAVPRVPLVLHPGETWSGIFSGRGRFPGKTYLRVMFGRFSLPDHPADAFVAVTCEVAQLR